MSSASASSAVMKSDSAATMSTSSPLLTQQLAAQILKPIGGKPIFIGGKPATILASGKPFSIGGKHMLISRGSGGSSQVSQILEAVPGSSVGTITSGGVSILSQVSVVLVHELTDDSVVGIWCRPDDRRFESHSNRHVGTLGKSFTRSCL